MQASNRNKRTLSLVEHATQTSHNVRHLRPRSHAINEEDSIMHSVNNPNMVVGKNQTQLQLRRSSRIRLSSAIPITCLDYGRDRKTVFPEYFFCGKCDIWESFVDTRTVGSKKRHSTRNKCEANHQNPCHPTTLKENVIRSRSHHVEQPGTWYQSDSDTSTSIDDDDDDDLDESGHDDSNRNPGHAIGNGTNVIDLTADALCIPRPIDSTGNSANSTGNNARNLYNMELACTRCQQMVDDINALQRKIAVLNKKVLMLSRNSCPDEIQSTAAALIAMFPTRHRGNGAKRKRQKLADAVIQEMYANPVLKKAIDDTAKATMKKCYSPFRILRIMDRTGGKLNLEAIALLRSLEIDVDARKGHHHNTILPSEHSLKSMIQLLQEAGKIIAPFAMGQTENNQESLEFSSEHVVKVLLEATKMDTVDTSSADTQVKMAQAIDGSRFSTNLQFVMYGLKLSDPRARCPWTKAPLFDPRGETTLQSRNNQIPLKIVLGSESEAMYSQFSNLFRNVHEYERFIVGEQEKEIMVDAKNVCSDLKASWTGLKRGGACKVKKYFCHCCTITSNLAATSNPLKCTRWCSGRPDEWCCYHTTFLTEEVQVERENQLQLWEATSTSLCEINNIGNACKLNNKDDPRVKTRENMASGLSIHYDFSTESKANRIRYSDRVDHDLLLRQMSTEGRLSERQSRLHARMVDEHKVKLLADEIEAGKSGQGSALFQVLFNPPCVLHMQMRISIKIITVLLRKGLENALSGAFDETLFHPLGILQPSAKQRFCKYVNELERIMNTCVLGDVFFPTTWKAPIDEKERKFFPLTMDNHRCRRCIANIDVLVKFCLTNESNNHDEFIAAVEFFQETMTLLCKKTMFSNEDIEEFQDLADHFCQKWLSLMSLPGMTNYIHMLASGHIAEYLYRHRNLYVYSNQGWEALNGLVKQVYFRRTQRGGAAGRSGKRSRLRGIGCWLQRRLVFMVTETEEDLYILLDKHRDNNSVLEIAAC